MSRASDAVRDYWQEAIGMALDEAGAYDMLTRDQRHKVAAGAHAAAESFGEAFGHHEIPSRESVEVAELRALLARERAEHAKRDDIWREDIARRCGAAVDSVGIKDGLVAVGRR